MPIKNFIKENFALTVGITLPVLLVILFFTVSVIPKAFSEPPQYEMLFTSRQYENKDASNIDFSLHVKDGKVFVKATQSKDNNYYRTRLFAYDGKADSVREVSVTVDRTGEYAVTETYKWTVDPNTKAPDGYEFDAGGYRSGGLAGELLVGGYRNNAPRVKKSGYGYKIPPYQDRGYYYYDIQFLGWVVKKD